MNLSLLNKIGIVGLITIVIGAVVNIIVTIVDHKNHLSAMPVSYKVIIVACFWVAIAVVGCIIYFVLRKLIKA